MPFIQRTVEPKLLCRRWPDSPASDDLDEVTNCTLVGALKQLASLVVYADEIFSDLTAQVRSVQQRSERLKTTIERVDDAVAKLNAKNVSVPVGDLKTYSRIKQHYVSHRPTERNFFVTDTRPDTVRRLYASAVVSPVCVMRQIDHYRNDGCRSSNLCTARDWLSDDDIVEGIPEPKMLELCPATIDSVPSSESEEVDAILRRLPSPEEKTYVMSLKFPYSDVPIDVTGTGFRRMASLRRSFLQHVEYLTKRKKRGKRRNTVTGGGSVADNRDVVEALKEANVRKNNRLSAGTQTSPERCRSDGERSPSSSSSSSSRVAFPDDVAVCRAFSEIGSNDGLNSLKKKSKTKSKSEEKDVQISSLESEKASLPIGLKWFHRKSRNRNSIIGSLSIYEELERVKKSKRGFFGSLRSSPPVVEETSSPSKSSMDSAVVTRSSRRAHIRGSHRSSLPISVPCNGTGVVTVKMRENSARGNSKGGEDGGQSSSGNWSASSSTRTSMESEDQQTQSTASPDLLNRTGSQTSLSKDSALSDRATPNEELRWHDNTGYHSDASVGTSSSVQKPNAFRFMKHSITKDTARWLRSLEEEGPNGRSVGETSSSGTITPRIHRRAVSPLDAPLAFVDDGESSEFSVDTDGYYTSMHTDSGLRALPIGRKPEDGSTLSKLSDLHECGSSTTVSSMCSKDGASSEGSTSSKKETSITDGEGATSSTTRNSPEMKKAQKKIPPPPPPRRSTLTVVGRLQVSAQSAGGFQRDGSPADSVSSTEGALGRQRRQSTTSTSSSRSEGGPDSEPEQGEKFKLKTVINSGRIPSMCVVTPSPSDDEEALVADDTEDPGTAPRSLDMSSSTFRSGKEVKVTEKLPSVPEELPNWSASDAVVDNAAGAAAFQSLPRTFNRSASFNSRTTCGQHANSWPRVPNQFVYKPETIAIASKNVELEIQPPTGGGTMMTFTQLPTNTGLQERPNSIAVPHSASGFYLNQGATPSHPEIRVTPPHPSSASSAICGSGVFSRGRRGARVTLDPSGHVIHSTGSLPRHCSNLSSPDSSVGSDCGSPIESTCNITSPVQKRPNPNLPSPSCQVQSSCFSEIPSPRGSTTTTPSHSYDSNTLPRSKPSRCVERPAVSACQAGRTPASNLTPANCHVGTLPRRWNNFFHRREPQPLSSTPSPPEPLNSAKMGVYVRLDGHPIHLEPGSTASPSPNKATTLGPQTSLLRSPQSNQQQQLPSPDHQLQTQLHSSSQQQLPLSPQTRKLVQLPVQTANQQCKSSLPVTRPSCLQQNSPPSRIPVQSSTSNNTSALPLYYQPISRTPGYARPNNRSPTSPAGVASSTPRSFPPTINGSANLPLYYYPVASNPSQVPCVPQSHSIMRQPSPNSTTVPVGTSPRPACNGVPSIGRPSFPYPGSRAPQNWANHPGLAWRPSGANVPQEHAFNFRQQPAHHHYPMHSPQSHTGMQRAHISTGDPNCSGLPNPSTNAPPRGTSSLHPSPATPGRSFSPDNGSPLKAKSTMSNEDLYALIHRSKRRLNIKTDPERSISPSSSRSASPAQMGSIPKSNSNDGLLSPRSRSPLCLPGDRRSWAGDRSLLSPSPTPSTGSARSLPASSPGDRRSWASDRLGPNRPTSMHDFKLLLLQAGRTTPKEVSSGRRSAAEMLNASPCNQKPTVPSKEAPAAAPSFQPKSPRSPSDFPVHRPTPPRPNLYGGGRRHGLGRPTRANCVSSLLHNRTDVMSTPIFEDEGGEDSDEGNAAMVTPLLPLLRPKEIMAT